MVNRSFIVIQVLSSSLDYLTIDIVLACKVMKNRKFEVAGKLLHHIFITILEPNFAWRTVNIKFENDVTSEDPY